MTDTKKEAEPAKNPAPGPQSTKSVAATTAAPKDPAPGGEQVKNAVTDNTSSKDPEIVKNGVATPVDDTKAVNPSGSLPNTHDNPPPASQVVDDDARGRELTKAEEAELEELMGNDAEPSLSDKDRAAGEVSAKKFQKLLSVIPRDTPDEHVIWGAGGVVITLGDIGAVLGKVRIAD